MNGALKLAVQESRNSKSISFKSNLHTESTKDSVTIRFLSRHETMLCWSDFFVLLIEELTYHCTLALKLHYYLFFQPLTFTVGSSLKATEMSELIDGYCSMLALSPSSLIIKRSGIA